MSELFAKLYLDEDMSFKVAEMVRADGFNVLSVHECHRQGLMDDEQLAYAASNSMAIVTHNRVDFEELAQQYFEQEKTHHGIIILRQDFPRVIADKLIAALNQYTADELVNQILYL